MQGLVWVSFALYFRCIVFINRERLKTRGPMLVISNHPNTLMDPLMALYRMREQCYLLANYSLFKNPISNAILSTLYCIPIQRINDVPEGQPLRNEEAFQRCDQHLLAGGSIYIAVEGTSYPERRIRELKTGMSRIAFSAEMQKNFELNLRILPIVITYFEPLKFWKEVVVEVGETISVDGWRDTYLQNPRKAITLFTENVEQQMMTQTIQCKSAEEDKFLKKIEAILQSENHLDTQKHYERSKQILGQFHQWQETDLAGYNIFNKAVKSYFKKLKFLKINDLNKKNYAQKAPLSVIKVLVGLPIFIYGWINNIIPAWLSDKLVHWLKLDFSYDTTVRYTGGLILFPLFWWLQQWGLENLLSFPINGWLYLLTVVATGLVAYELYIEGVNFYHFLKFRKADHQGQLTQLREPIVNKLNDLLTIQH